MLKNVFFSPYIDQSLYENVLTFFSSEETAQAEKQITQIIELKILLKLSKELSNKKMQEFILLASETTAFEPIHEWLSSESSQLPELLKETVNRSLLQLFSELQNKTK